MKRDLTEKQVMKIHEIIERHSTDVVDYELATDDINAYLLAAPSEPQASEPQRTLHIPWINFGRCDCGWSSSIEAKEENYEQWCVHAKAAEPQASEPLPDDDDQLNYDVRRKRAAKPQPESVSAQGNKQVFMCGCISYNTALVPRCPIHKQASEPRQCIWSDAND